VAPAGRLFARLWDWICSAAIWALWGGVALIFVNTLRGWDTSDLLSAPPLQVKRPLCVFFLVPRYYLGKH